jgi:hypothetical protein
MTSPSSYQDTARAYTAGVRTFFTRPVTATMREGAERDAEGVVAADTLAAQAERLVPLSADFTRAAAAQLDAPDAAVRADTAAQLLTKALTDLQISAQLLQAAMDEEAGPPATHGAAVERGVSIAAPPDLEENLRFLLSEPGAAPAPAERGVTSLPSNVQAARVQLTQLSGDTLGLIRDRAGKTGQAAISGLLVLGVAEVAEAAGVVGLEIAIALGVGEKVTRLYTLVREFALSAYNSLVALLGPTLAQTAAQQVLAWVNDVVQGEKFAQLLDKLYETGNTGQNIKQEVDASQAALEKFVAALRGVDALGGKFGQQIGTIDKLLKGLRLFGAIPTTVVPQGKLLMAAAYLVIGGYVVLAGADFVDAPNLRWLDRVPGVRRVVETELAGA